MENLLKEHLKKHKKVAIAFSGGVDSLLLSFVAKEVLGSDNVLCICAKTQFCVEDDFESQIKYKDVLGVNFIDVDVLSNRQVVKNDVERCYYCKKMLFKQIINYAKNKGFDVVFDGSNASDNFEERKGFKAIKELFVENPLLECGYSKSQILQMAKNKGILKENYFSNSCVATRIATGEKITLDKLNLVSRIENVLRNEGLIGARARLSNNNVRLELRDEYLKNVSNDMLECLRGKLNFVEGRISIDILPYGV